MTSDRPAGLLFAVARGAVAGLLAQRLVEPALESRRGTTSH
jgi:hypothetical protein